MLFRSPSPATICSYRQFSYTPISSINPGTTFSWTRLANPGINSNTTSSGTGNINEVLINNTSSPLGANYVYTLTANGCTNPITFTVPISVIPAPYVTANASNTSICVGQGVNFTSSSSLVSSPPVILFEDFNSAINGATTGPNGWTTTLNTGTGGIPANANWTVRPNNYANAWLTFSSNDATKFYLSDSRSQGGNTYTTLISPQFSTVGYTTVQLDFYDFYDDRGNSGDFAYIDVSTDGTNWTNLVTYNSDHGSSTNFEHQTESLNGYISNPSLYIRFRYVATSDRYWAIDNVTVSGTSATNPIIQWTSIPAGFTSSVANPGPVMPTVTTSYIVTYTDPLADPNLFCPGINSVTVTVNQLPVMTSTNSATVCSGGTVSISLTSDIPSTYSWVATPNGNVTGESTTAQNTDVLNNTLTNSTSSVQTVTYTVTPTSLAGCVGTPQTVLVTVNPSPTVNAVSNRTAVCSGTPAAAINFGSPTSGVTFDWTSTADVGFGTSGTGNIPAYTTYNGTTSPLTATVSVVASINGCNGPPRTFTVAVNPIPNVSITADYCSVPGFIRLTASPSGLTNYTWYRDGAAGSIGTGNPIQVNIADRYSVVATNSYGCSATAYSPIINELILNGNFEGGNSKFTISYTYRGDIVGNNELRTGGVTACGQTFTGGEGYYGVGTNGQNYHSDFWGVDHTSGSGNFMIVNGVCNEYIVWEQGPITILPGKQYYFSAWGMTLNDKGNTAQLRFEVTWGNSGGPISTQQVGSTATLANGVSNNTNSWLISGFFYGNTTAPANATWVRVRIINLRPNAGGDRKSVV